MFQIAYIVAENKRRQDINEELLGRFYIDQDVVTIRSTDKLPADAYLDENLPYTRTGRHVLTLSPTGREGIHPPQTDIANYTYFCLENMSF